MYENRVIDQYQPIMIPPPTKSKPGLEAAGVTIRGSKREVNEDALFYSTDQINGRRVGRYVVCDGMGGHEAGDIASQIAVQTVSKELEKVFKAGVLPVKLSANGPSWPMLHHWVQTAITRANQNIREYAHALPGSDGRLRLGTTITLLLVCGDLATIANVGDSRTYVWRVGELIQITRDHSLVSELIEVGQLTEIEAITYPYRNLILRSLGASEEVEVDLFEWRVRPGDKFLLCSDGVWQTFPDTAELGRWLGSAITPEDLCQQLVIEAKRRDGSDDMSAIIVEAHE